MEKKREKISGGIPKSLIGGLWGRPMYDSEQTQYNSEQDLLRECSRIQIFYMDLKYKQEKNFLLRFITNYNI
jgi:hypothetical protein